MIPPRESSGNLYAAPQAELKSIEPIDSFVSSKVSQFIGTIVLLFVLGPIVLLVIKLVFVVLDLLT